ncbi:DUF1656 domain-containing protein [Sphingomonas abietis]|uniref:DUF1656 domain-containing protein n=1 Tax=Sphingomonas abietis TaxID=3012344 RepID=A0ABY7NV15_9SPHN|nr:DUF1656 domain-containing protein [Sphingomonas abietis]WBO24256.1 DUF1656 domain-containing protein [Sphingomonas abietis]
MTHDFLIGGVILSPIVPELLIAVLLTALLSIVLMRLGFYRATWHRPLVEISFFCMILGAIVALTPDGTPLWGADTNAGAEQ